MSRNSYQLRSKRNNEDFLATCDHKIQERFPNKRFKKDSKRSECPTFETVALKSKAFEEVLREARKERSLHYDQLVNLFKGLENYKNDEIITIKKEILKVAVNFGLNLSNIDLITYVFKKDLLHELNLLLALGLKIDTRAGVRTIIICMALKYESISILEKLKELGFEPNGVQEFEKLSLRTAKWLIDNGLDVNRKMDDEYLLHRLCDKRRIDLVKLLVDHGANIEIKDDRGQSPFHRIINFQPDNNTIYDPLNHRPSDLKICFDLLQVLLNLGADIDSIDDQNKTPLFEAISSGRPAVIIFLLSKGANLSAPKLKELGFVPFILLDIYKNCKFTSFEYILQKLLDINEKDSEGQTCLHKIMRNDFKLEHVALLIKYGAHINCQDSKGNSPLHILGNKESYSRAKLKFLLRKGADIYLRNDKNETAIYSLLR